MSDELREALDDLWDDYTHATGGTVGFMEYLAPMLERAEETSVDVFWNHMGLALVAKKMNLPDRPTDDVILATAKRLAAEAFAAALRAGTDREATHETD